MKNKQSLSQTAKLANQNIPAELRWTPQRQELFALLSEVKRPVSAYELIELYQKAHGRKLQPMLVYRGLDFLITHGYAVKLESRNSYLSLRDPQDRQNCLFFICDSCGSAEGLRLGTIDLALKRAALKTGYRIRRPVMEVEGVCQSCQDQEAV